MTVLSSGRPVYLERTLASLKQFLTPPPSDIYLFDDGGVLVALDYGEPELRLESSPIKIGQCAAQAHCWQAAVDSPLDWVLHWEDDVVLLRPLDLRDLVAVMEEEQNIAQMALVRCPWGAEIEHGGYIPQFPGYYDRRETRTGECQKCGSSMDGEVYEWIATTRNWSNTGLWPTALTREFDWPDQPGCETTMGPMILDKYPDAVFGLWGWGEPHCAHIGVERAPGSHGY